MTQAVALAEPSLGRALSVQCGVRWFGFAYAWARNAVELPPISLAPHAPGWLVGAANVDGRVVPVVDLLAWVEPGQWVDAQARDARVLIGGAGETTLGLLFRGLPRMVSVRPGPASTEVARLASLVMGCAEEDPAILVLDGPGLLQALTDELALG
jgi:chemotaxis signal transduction protein